MDDILKELGWGDGFRMPVADEENKALELEIQKKQKEKENLKFTLERITERVATMKNHSENILIQLRQNQNLIYAQNNQKAVEENLAKLARTEDKSLTSEIRKVKKEEEEIQSRLENVQGDLDRTLQRIEQLNSTIKWDKDALLTWDEEVSRGDEDTQMLEKFRKEDEAKFRELELKRQYLNVDLESRRDRLVNLKNDVSALEQSLDKTAQMFRRQHQNRSVLVHQWESSVRILHQRDEDLNRITEEIGNLKLLAKERLKDLEEQKTFFENEERNNQEIERDIDNFKKLNCETKENIRILESSLTEDNDELSTLRTVLGTTTSTCNTQMLKCKSTTKEIESKNRQLEEMKEKAEKAKEECMKVKEKAGNLSFQVSQTEEMLLEEEKTMERSYKEFKKLNELMFQVSQQAKELKETEKNLAARATVLESCKVGTLKDIKKAKMELNKQKELLYNLDFAYMEKDIIFNRMQNPTEERDNLKYEKKIEELESAQRGLTATNNLLTREVTRLEDDMRKITIDLQGDAKEENYLKNKRQDKMTIFENGEKQLRTLRIQNQNKQVDENMLKLRVRQAENAIDHVGGKVFCLEKQRLELEEAMKEREVEIKSLRDVLNARRRVLNEQASNLSGRISLAKLKVQNLKNKYDVEVLKLGKDENGEPLSLSYIKIKESQERFELRELGDKLDSQIKKAEKEIEAMENTLKVVNATNRAFRSNLQSIDANSPEQLEKQRLEQTQSQQLEDYRKAKAVFESLQVITLDLEEEYQQKLRMEEAIIRSWKEKDQKAEEIDRELKDQEEKLERAGKQLKRLTKEIRGTKVQKFQTMEEKDIELRELMDQNEYGLQQLAELVAKTYDAGPVVVQYLTEKGLTLPSIKSPAGSLKCPSTGSLPSARSSISTSRSSDSSVSKSSSCVYAPSVVTLDSSRLCESSDSQERAREKRPCGASKRRSQSEVKKRGSK